MLKIFLTGLSIFYSLVSLGQARDTAILFVPCKSGELIIDGISKGFREANDVHREQLTFGDHYIQLKTDSEKFNSILKIDNALSSNILQIGCAIKNPALVRLLEKKINLSGALTSEVDDNHFGLDNGDELNIRCEVLNKKGNATISIVEYSTGTEIYRKERFNKIENEVVRIPKRAIYKILLNTDALFGKDVSLTLDRNPSSKGDPNFKTSVHFESDTIATEVLNTTTRVYSLQNLDHSNKTVVTVNLPRTTTYWTYWVGVGQESKEKMKQFISGLSAGANLLSTNPLFLFGMKMIPSLPMLNATSTINYRFMDSRNAQLFQNGLAHQYFTFKQGSNISTDYAIITQPQKDLSLCLWNENSWNGQDVEVRVMAFTVRRWLEMDK